MAVLFSPEGVLSSYTPAAILDCLVKVIVGFEYLAELLEISYKLKLNMPQ